MGERLVNMTVASTIVTLWYLLIFALFLIACVFYCHCICWADTIIESPEIDAHNANDMEMQYL